LFRTIKSPRTELSDELLMHQVCMGERRAFELLYDRYFDKLVGFAKVFIADEQQAEDVVQEVFIRIIQKPEQFEREKKFSTWVYSVTGNLCKNILRDEQNRARLMKEQVSPRLNFSSEMHHQMDYKLLQEKIRTVYVGLSEKEKQLYTLRFEQELSIREIAAIVQIPEGSVKSGIYYLLKKLEEHLKEFAYEK
jgi:RNA polymerase sigma-70 factor (ECF subfamily)